MIMITVADCKLISGLGKYACCLSCITSSRRTSSAAASYCSASYLRYCMIVCRFLITWNNFLYILCIYSIFYSSLLSLLSLFNIYSIVAVIIIRTLFADFSVNVLRAIISCIMLWKETNKLTGSTASSASATSSGGKTFVWFCTCFVK